jgi:hypothetical protein
MLKLSPGIICATLLASTFLALPMRAAIDVQYSTSGTFSDTTTAAAITFTGVTTGTASQPFPVAINLGTFTSLVTSGNTAVSGTFDLTVSQLIPNSGSDILTSDMLTGHLTPGNSQVDVSFSGDGLVYSFNSVNYIEFGIGGVTYGVQEDTLLNPANPAMDMEGVTPLNGIIISDSAVPEPASVLLFGTVLAGVALIMRKRMQTNA